MAKKQTRVSLRFWHPTWKAAAFSEALGLTPRFAHTVGEPRMTPTGTPLEGCYTESYWCYNLSANKITDAEELLSVLVASLDSHADFLRSVKKSGGRAEVLVCIISPGDFGESFNSEALLSLGRLGLGLSFDIYFGEPDKP